MPPSLLPTPQAQPSSYLDEISAPVKQPLLQPWKLWALIGGVLLVAIIGIILLNSNRGKSQTETFRDFVYRVQALESTSSSNSKLIKNSKLEALNASLLTVLTGIDRQSSDSLAVYNLNSLPNAPKDSPITSEFATLAKKLDDARLNVAFDRTYAREVAYQLGTLRAEIKKLEKDTDNGTVKTYLETSDNNLAPLVKEFSAFNDSEA